MNENGARNCETAIFIDQHTWEDMATASTDEMKMEINIDPQKLQHPKKKLEFFLKRDAVLQGVGKTANELRRRLFNRQEKRKTDYARLPMVQEAKKDMFDIRMDLVQQDVKSRIIETHTRTQFEMEETFRWVPSCSH
ncbi:unnamed protein product [Aphanomyces euteiches]